MSKEAKESKSKKEEMPSPDINPGNSLQRVEECMKYMSLQQWSKFDFLYPCLFKFQDVRIKGAGKLLRDDDEFTCAWNKLRAYSVDSLLKNLESAQSYDEFLGWLKRLSGIVTDQRTLWNILHTEVQPSLKVTLEQSKQIASRFFSPEILFEFGLDSFLQSGLCDFSLVKTETELIDLFYSSAGFMRACNLDPKFQLKGDTLTKFSDFVKRILTTYVSLPEFDANRFVWLIESIHDNLHIPDANFRSICEEVLKDFSKQNNSEESSLSLLHKMCIISTSPFLQSLSILNETVNTFFKSVQADLRKFVHRYVFGSFVNIQWTGEAIEGCSEPVLEWKLYVANLCDRIKEKKELPTVLIVDLLDDSLSYFNGYYGEVQPSKERSVNLRIDIFEIINVCTQFYPDKIPSETLSKIWYLLYVAAFSGASNDDIKDINYQDPEEDNTSFLGLKHSDREFDDYRKAICVLGKKFEAEKEIVPQMIEFIRKNY